jgi:hypothetical protein
VQQSVRTGNVRVIIVPDGRIGESVRLFLFLFASFLTGCTEPRQTQFNEADFTAAAGRGSGVVIGNVYMMLGNTKLTADREVVVLTPVNAYTRENVRRRFLGGENLQSADNRIDKYLHYTSTDADGRFTITGVPSGDYYLESEINWTTQSLETDNDQNSYYMYRDHQKLVFDQLSVRDNQTIHISDWNQNCPIQDAISTYGGLLLHPHHQFVSSD